MHNLINGNQFQRLLKQRERSIQNEYNIEKIDIRIIHDLKKGMDANMLEDLINMGVFDEKEIADSLTRLHRQGLIELMRADGDVHAVAFRLTRAGSQLWDQLQKDYEYANEVMFSGMTEEQTDTFKRLSQLVIQNIDKELKKQRSKERWQKNNSKV